jgi:LmbE family N-acetylglucosaminyl deacetylase
MWPFTKRPEPRRAEAASPPRAAPRGNPLPQPLDLAGVHRALVVAPHPDDETLGCGGTLARLAPVCEIHVLQVTNGDGGGGLPPETSAVRKQEMARAVRTLGIASEVLHMDEPDGRFEPTPAFGDAFMAIVRRLDPQWVFLPWLGDSHADHALLSAQVSRLLRDSRVDKLLYYETWTPVPATHVVDITATLETKKAALLCHETALRHGNYLDAVLGLNAYRGLYLPRGDVPARAEAFAVTSARDNAFC